MSSAEAPVVGREADVEMRHRIALGSAELLVRAMNRLLRRRLGAARPVFLDASEVYPSLAAVDAEYEAIREELLHVLPRSAELPRYHDVDEDQAEIAGQGNTEWRVLFVDMHGMNGRLPNRELFPRTVAALERVPGRLQAFFSILEPHKSVPTHRGPYLGYLRYHLGLVVPEVHPPRLRVKDRWHTWHEGESVFFDDSFDHEVVNESDEPRVVLMVDVLRPLPWPLALMNRLVRRLAFDRAVCEPAIARIPQL